MTTDELIQIYFSRKLPRFLTRLVNFLSFSFLKFLERLVRRTSLSDWFCAFLPFCTVFEKIQKNCLKKIAPLLSCFKISASVIIVFKYRMGQKKTHPNFILLYRTIDLDNTKKPLGLAYLICLVILRKISSRMMKYSRF